MAKRILFFLVALVVLFTASFFLNVFFVPQEELTFSLLAIYLYHAIAAFIVYVIVEFIADKMPNQAGYAYLASIFLKIGFFVLIFSASVFAKENLTKPERISLVVPLFLFLIAEAIAVSKLLNSK